jgi:cell division septation protein DedD
MRQLLRELAVLVLLLATVATPAAGQQGSIQITAAAHSLQGDPARTGGQPAFQPDLGVSWLRPGSRFGMFQMEIRATARDEDPRLGRTFISLRDFNHRGVKYTLEAGDVSFSPAQGEYRLRNLHTPSVNFAGISVRASSARASAGFMAGRATAMRNYFGTDTETLDQGLVVGRGGYAFGDRLQVSARAAHVRTRDLKEFRFTIADSDQAGGGAKAVLTPVIHLSADASLVRFRRRGEARVQRDVSAFAGATFLLARGWAEVSASRFSPGELPILTQPHADRRVLYAAGEYDLLGRFRAFGGWEVFQSNLDEHPMATAPPGEGSRGFAGIRVPLWSRSSAAFRIERGDRRSRFVGAGLTRVSDTGGVSGEWQAGSRLITGFARFAYRENVESESLPGTYRQHDGSALAFVNLSRDTQVFGSVTAIRNVTAAGSGHTFWQFGGGTQSQIMRRRLWLRAEGLASRNLDLLTQRMVPQQTINLGLNGQIANNTVMGLTIYADRLPSAAGTESDSWVTRSSLRVTRTFPTESHRTATAVAATMARHGGTGSVNGIVFSDWNGNGTQDEGEAPLENIPVRLANLGSASTSASGEFAFLNVPIGMQQVGIDLSSLPVDFDPPPVPQVQLSLGRGETKQLAFGLVPLGTVTGIVVRDANGNAQADPSDEPLAGAVVVLNGGLRSEQVRAGRFRFDAVRAGRHTVELLAESLPEGSMVIGEAAQAVSVGRDRTAPHVAFVVNIQRRPEIRRVFGSDPEPADTRPPPSPSTPAASPSTPAGPPSAPPPPQQGGVAGRETFTIQVAAFRNRSRGVRLVNILKKEGFAAYLVEPTASDPIAPYKVRVGTYESRADAERNREVLEKRRGEKLWIVAVKR